MAGLTLCDRPLNHRDSGSVITTIICLHVSHFSGVALLGTHIPDPNQVSTQKLASFQIRTLLNEGRLLRTSLDSKCGKVVRWGSKQETKQNNNERKSLLGSKGWLLKRNN